MKKHLHSGLCLLLLAALLITLSLGCSSSGGGDGNDESNAGDGDNGGDEDPGDSDIDTGGGGQDVGDDDAGGGGPGGSADQAEFGNESWTETGDGSVFLIARYFTTGLEKLYPPDLLLYAEDSDSFLWIDLYADLYNPAYEEAYWTDTYPFGFSTTVGFGEFWFYDESSSLSCTALGGGVTVTALADPGGTVSGTISVTEWDETSSDSCPDPEVVGTFSVARNSDNSFGNDGSGTDEFVVNRTGGTISPANDDFQEVATTRYDPYITADTSFGTHTNVHLSAKVISEPSYYVTYEHHINITLEGTLAVGTYQVEEFTVPGFSRFRESHWTGSGYTYRFCEAKEGTIEISQIGGAGEQIVGTYSITDVEEISGLTGCPASYSGSFVATVEDYPAI